MATNYNPDSTPNLTPEMYEMAERTGMKIISVICDGEHAKVGDQTGVSFLVLGDFLPRVGEHIELEDGLTCQVRRVQHRVVSREGVSACVANVYAVAPRGF